MKLFSSKPTWASLIQAGVKLSRISTASVQMKQIASLNNAISQLSTMRKFNPNAKGVPLAIDVLTACVSQINAVIQPSVKTFSPVEPEGASFNRRP